MSDPFVPIVENQPSPDPIVSSTAATKDAATVGAAAQANAKLTSETKINNMAELQTKSPELWNSMLQGIAMAMCQRWHDKNEDLRRMMRESNDIA